MSLWLEIVLGVLAVVAAGASAVAAWKAWSISRKAFDWQKRQTQPRIQVTARLDKDSMSMILLVIENVGKGSAFEIEFDLSREIPSRAWGFTLTDDDRKKIQPMTDGPLVSGIPALAAGDQRVINWGQYGGLSSVLGDEYVRVIARYKDESKHELDSLSLLEVKSFEGTSASDNKADTKMAKALEKIASCVERASGGSQPLLVETSVQRRARRRRDHETMMKQMGR